MKQYSDWTLYELLYLFYCINESSEEIAKELGKTKSSVTSYKQHFRKQGKDKRKITKNAYKDIEQVILLKRKGYTLKEIAFKLGKSYYSVAHISSRYDKLIE